MNEIRTIDSFFKVPVKELGDVEGSQFSGILIPEPEIGQKKAGVDHVFLEGAEEYYRKYQGYDYWSALLKTAAAKVGINTAKIIVEFGSGFGNSTLPLLKLFPEAHVVATDISPNLLCILHRLLRDRDLIPRCTIAAMDAQKDYLKSDIADIVVGSAILHHLADPGIFIERAMDILRPGGCAIFYEPYEAGLAILRLICLEVGAEARRRSEDSPALFWLKQVAEQLEPQIFRERYPGWSDINDKWAFPRSVLENIKDKVKASELIIYPLHDNVDQFSRQITYMMRAYSEFSPEDFPKWAWDIFRRFERDLFSPEQLIDFPIEVCIIYRK